MELFLNNVGVIKDSEIILDGLTVITGKNSSGKTTVGKTMYSLLSASTNLEEAFEESKRNYIINQISNINRTLKIGRYSFSHRMINENNINKTLITLITRRYFSFPMEKLYEYLYDLCNTILDFSIDDYVTFMDFEESEWSIDVLQKNFETWKNQALLIGSTTKKFINDNQAFYKFNKDRTKAFMNHEFDNQIKPVKSKRSTSRIILTENGCSIVDLKIKSKGNFDFSNESSFYYPYDKCIYIDNPYIIDDLDRFNYLKHSHGGFFDTEQSDSIISSEDIKDRNEILCDFILNYEINNFFDYSEFQEKYSKVFEKINKIVPGEFEKNSDGYYYVSNGTRLSVKNLATGSKMFFIIKKLLINGLINEKTMLILDEPESHLHPEWINKFAEILTILIKEIKINILLTTHSPNLLLALNVYSKKMEIFDHSHFYLAEKSDDGYFSQIKNIDESIGEGYAHLSIPIVEMNLENDAIDGE